MSLLTQESEKMKGQKDRINELAQSWCSARPDEIAVRNALLTELSQVLLDLGPSTEGAHYEYGLTYRDLYQESVANAITSLIKGNYDPQKSPFYQYFCGVRSRMWANRLNLYRHQKGTWKNENGEKKHNYETDASLQQKVNTDEDSENCTLEARQSVGSVDAMDEALMAQERLFAILPMAINMWNSLQSGSETKRRRGIVLQMAYTDYMVAKIRGADAGSVYLTREGQLFQSMDLDFLDFFMLERCRTMGSLVSSGLKLYGVLVPGEEMKECGLPLPLKVHVKYLKDAHDIKQDITEISKRRTKLEQMIQSIQTGSQETLC